MRVYILHLSLQIIIIIIIEIIIRYIRAIFIHKPLYLYSISIKGLKHNGNYERKEKTTVILSGKNEPKLYNRTYTIS